MTDKSKTEPYIIKNVPVRTIDEFNQVQNLFMKLGWEIITGIGVSKYRRIVKEFKGLVFIELRRCGEIIDYETIAEFIDSTRGSQSEKQVLISFEAGVQYMEEQLELLTTNNNA